MVQAPLKFDAAQTRHFDIHHHAINRGSRLKIQKRFCGGEQSTFVAQRLYKIIESFADCQIVIDNRYNGGM